MTDPFVIDGCSGRDLALTLQLPRVEVLAETTSTLDVAHQLASEGALAGTLVFADRQTAGRGRGGNRWESPSNSGLWITLIERPAETSGIDVMSLRVGLQAASALDRFAAEPVRLKWPNDLYVGIRKLGGILIEARWREQRLEWIAIGIGVNVSEPFDVPAATGLDPGTRRIEVLVDLIPALREAAASVGDLTRTELTEWGARDMACGRRCSQPAQGTVQGISASGELLVALADSVARFRTGSLLLDPIS